jgi:alkyl hydroperoxide reductase subunit AhpC
MKQYTLKEIKKIFGEYKRVKNKIYLYESWDYACLQFYPKKFTFNMALELQAKRLKIKNYKRLNYKFIDKNKTISCIEYKKIN